VFKNLPRYRFENNNYEGTQTMLQKVLQTLKNQFAYNYFDSPTK